MDSRTLAASAGWKLYGPTWIQICAPNFSVPRPGNQRQQQQHDAGQAEGVGEPLQRPVIAQHDRHQNERDHSQCGPDQLLAGTCRRR